MYKILTSQKELLADTLTPVSIYQRIRDNFSNTLLLESSDYGANDNSYAYVCFNPIAHISIKGNLISKSLHAKLTNLITKTCTYKIRGCQNKHFYF